MGIDRFISNINLSNDILKTHFSLIISRFDQFFWHISTEAKTHKEWGDKMFDDRSIVIIVGT